MKDAKNPMTADADSTVHRTVRLRLLPQTTEKANRLAQYAGACRWLYNHFLAENDKHYSEYLHKKEAGDEDAEKPCVGAFHFYTEFSNKSGNGVRDSEEYPWLKNIPVVIGRSACKRLALAFDSYMKGIRDKPNFKARYRGEPSFDIEVDVKTDGQRLFIPRLGEKSKDCWLQVRGHNPYHQHGKATKVTIRRECNRSKPARASGSGEKVRQDFGKWYAYIAYKIPAATVNDAADGIVGVDMNVGQVAFADGDGNNGFLRLHKAGGGKSEVLHLDEKWNDSATRIARLEKRRKLYQKRMAKRQGGVNPLWRKNHAKGIKPSNRYLRVQRQAAKIYRKAAWIRHDYAHEISKLLSAGYQYIGIENLSPATMTAKGGNRKKKMNKGILSTAWGKFGQFLSYKAGEERVVKVPAPYTSQTCRNPKCGHAAKENRKDQMHFKCVKCGYENNADINAAENVRDRTIEELLARGVLPRRGKDEPTVARGLDRKKPGVPGGLSKRNEPVLC